VPSIRLVVDGREAELQVWQACVVASAVFTQPVLRKEKNKRRKKKKQRKEKREEKKGRTPDLILSSWPTSLRAWGCDEGGVGGPDAAPGGRARRQVLARSLAQDQPELDSVCPDDYIAVETWPAGSASFAVASPYSECLPRARILSTLTHRGRCRPARLLQALGAATFTCPTGVFPALSLPTAIDVNSCTGSVRHGGTSTAWRSSWPKRRPPAAAR